MKKEMIKQLKQQLETEKERLQKELAEFAKQNPKNTEDWNAEFQNIGDKEDENAEEVATFSTNLTLERTLESTLRDVEKALDKIAKGSYGVCKYCGKDIDEKRLLARPASGSCVERKKKFTQEL
jgi:RNA polymerase-binding protein DksA